MSEDLTDDRIDDVARQMTASEPPDAAAFRRRVLARIDGGETPRRSWRATFVLTPIAVAAAIVIALFVAREPGERRQEAESRPPATPAVRTPAPFEPGAASVEAIARHAGQPRLADAGDQRRAEAPPLFEPNDVASIAVAPLVVDTMAPEPISVERLDAIAPIAVAPLDITDSSRRNP